jgi:hypothetical protein
MTGLSLLPSEFSMSAVASIFSDNACCEAPELLYDVLADSELSVEALHDTDISSKSAKSGSIESALKVGGRLDSLEEAQFSVITAVESFSYLVLWEKAPSVAAENAALSYHS